MNNGMLSQEEIDALLKANLGGGGGDESAPEPEAAPSAPQAKKPSFADFNAPPGGGTPAPGGMGMGAPPGAPPGKSKRSTRLTHSAKVENPVNIQPAVFQPFDVVDDGMETTNLEVILNLDLELRVELGKTSKSVRDILEMGSGSVMELNKQNGEPVDLVVNMKQFAKGEMIVIGENFGVRVTDILSIHEIIEALRK